MNWDIAVSIAQIVSAIATAAAVIISLWLVRRQTFSNIRINAHYGYIMSDTNTSSPGEFLYLVRATNAGLRDVTIDNVIWSFGIFRKKRFIQIPGFHPLSAPVPIKLVPSATAHFYFPGNWAEKSDDMSKLLGRHFCRWLNEVSLMIGVSLSTGETIYTRADKDVKSRLRIAIKQAN
jgi:hypothetical protein